MSKSGLGVIINMLAGNADSVAAFIKGIGKEILTLTMADDALHFSFTDGYKMKLFDDGQSCCERRYMMTDDDLSHFVGATLQNAEVRKAPDEPDEYGQHEVAFLIVTTSKGAFTMATHNEHNGYYGGFSIRAAVE